MARSGQACFELLFLRLVPYRADQQSMLVFEQHHLKRETSFLQLGTQRLKIRNFPRGDLEIESWADRRGCRKRYRSRPRSRHRSRRFHGDGCRCLGGWGGRPFHDYRRREDRRGGLFGPDTRDGPASQIGQARDQAHQQSHAHHHSDQFTVRERQFVAGGLWS